MSSLLISDIAYTCEEEIIFGQIKCERRKYVEAHYFCFVWDPFQGGWSTSSSDFRYVLFYTVWRLRDITLTIYFLVILDGFRHDYLSTHSTPNLDQILEQGVLAPRLQPEFPSFRETFLSSLLTGLHTEDHGVGWVVMRASNSITKNRVSNLICNK